MRGGGLDQSASHLGRGGFLELFGVPSQAFQSTLIHVVHELLTGEIRGEVYIAIEGDQVLLSSDLCLGLAAKAEASIEGKIAHILDLDIENRSADLQGSACALWQFEGRLDERQSAKLAIIVGQEVVALN